MRKAGAQLILFLLLLVKQTRGAAETKEWLGWVFCRAGMDFGTFCRRQTEEAEGNGCRKADENRPVSWEALCKARSPNRSV